MYRELKMLPSSVVRARVDAETKARAASALADMGLSVSDAIRLLMTHIAEERRLPFNVKAPTAGTNAAIEELESGNGRRFASLADLMADLRDEGD